MGAKVSKEMTDAIALIRAGMVPAQAAAQVGIARSTISRSRLFKDYQKEQAQAQRQAGQHKKGTKP